MMRIRFVTLFVALTLLVRVLDATREGTAVSGDADKKARLHQEAIAAYKAKDYPGFLAAAGKMLALEPSNPKYLYNAACAEALTGHNAEAVAHISALLDRGLDFGFDEESDFASLRASKEFAPIREKLDHLRKPIGKSEVAFILPERDQIPEGIAFDPASGRWFVSSVHRKKIVSRGPDGKVSDFAAEGADGLGAVLGIAVDSEGRVLWACTAALPEMTGFDKSLEGVTGVFKYDLTTGKLVKKYLLPIDGTKRALGDLAVAPSGDLYLSDGMRGGIYRIARGKDALEEFLPPGVLKSAQGIAFEPSDRRFYVADYAGGIRLIDIATRETREVSSPESFPLLGIDGVVYFKGSLIVTQNGIRPHRVTRLFLDARGERIDRGEILEMNNPIFSEPTLGTVVAGAYYYVANSQWGMFDALGTLAPTGKLSGPVILKLPLPGR